MKKKTILTAVAAVATAVCAQAQTRIVVPSEQAYTIGNVVSASGDTVSYLWFRNGTAIAGATSASYTIPANLATGNSVVFQRAAYGLDCLGGVAISNMVTIQFCDLIVNGVCWARTNCNNRFQFVANPYDLGAQYQWNRLAGYGGESGVIPGWSTTADPAATWTNGFPCPAGWRLPTEQDFRNLTTTSLPASGVWANGGSRGVVSGTNGRFYGYNAATCTISSMAGCIFLPAEGYHDWLDGHISDKNSVGYYFSSEQSNVNYASILYFTSTQGNAIASWNKTYGFSVRCVQDVQ